MLTHACVVFLATTPLGLTHDISGVTTSSVESAIEATQSSRQTQNVFHIMIDGLRWQEVFGGMQSGLLTKDNKVERPDSLNKRFGGSGPHERREQLMPFLWSTVAKEGQIFGNQEIGSVVRITNRYGVSYPGYSEAITGVADDARITGNRKIPNPNTSVYEWLNGKPQFAGKVAAFGAWDVFPFIFNQERSKVPVDDSMGPIDFGTLTPTIEVINRVRAETPYRWASASFDSLVFIPMLDWVKVNQPQLTFLCLGETDEFAHEGDYSRYLEAAHRADGYIRELWTMVQSMEQYRGTTTFIIHPDHGRGDTRGGHNDWWNHSLPKHPGCEATWLAVIGPDTAALGERRNVPEITHDRLAATIGALLGEDFRSAVPAAGEAIGEVLKR
ncbi:MAG: AP protein [Planctomycetes bacterium]|nr:AP protein [Planctomycetota bacterium]